MAYFPSAGRFGGGFSNPNFGGQAGQNGTTWGGLPNEAFGGMRPAPGLNGGPANQDEGMRQWEAMNASNQNNLMKQRQQSFMGMFSGSGSRPGPFGGGMVDPTAAINAAQPGITRTMTGNFNAAASRMGDLGMMGMSNGKMSAGTPYADMLGQAAREASDSNSEITNKYLYDAAKTNQDNQLQWAQLLGQWAQSGMFGGSGGASGGHGGSSGGYGGYSGSRPSAPPSAQQGPLPPPASVQQGGQTPEGAAWAAANLGQRQGTGYQPRDLTDLMVGTGDKWRNDWIRLHSAGRAVGGPPIGTR